MYEIIPDSSGLEAGMTIALGFIQVPFGNALYLIGNFDILPLFTQPEAQYELSRQTRYEAQSRLR